MGFCSWSERREVYVEPGARTSLALGAIGVLLALAGLLLGEPRPAEDATRVPSVAAPR